MKSIFFKIIVATTIITMVSCNQNKTKQSETIEEQTELPPSLREKDNSAVLIQLSAKEISGLAIETMKISSRITDYDISAPGVVFPAPDHSSIISTPINGQVINIKVYEGDNVVKGQELFRIQSLEFGTLISEYLQAQAEEKFQTDRLARIKQLVEETISSVSELDRATAEYQRAMAMVKSAYAKLRAVGVPDKEIITFHDAENFDPTLKIYAPISGVIEKNFVELGQSVNALENLSRILDTRKVLIRGYISPGEANLVSVGDSVAISKRQQEIAPIKGIITSKNPGLDENTRSVIVNIIIQTRNGWPKPGENLRLAITTSTKKEIIAIPFEALTYDGDQAIVFVKKSDNTYEKRAIQVEEINDRYVFIESGLSDNEEVAVTKVFSLKALSRFDAGSEE